MFLEVREEKCRCLKGHAILAEKLWCCNSSTPLHATTHCLPLCDTSNTSLTPQISTEWQLGFTNKSAQLEDIYAMD